MSKHTPVTWFVDIEGNRILANDDRATIICHMSATVRNPEVMAAAFMLSAAPDLLEALEASNLLLRTRRHACESNEVCRVLDVHISRNNAAIAKAKGESA